MINKFFSKLCFSEQFRQALDMMNRAVSTPTGLLGQQPGAKESMAYLTNVERQQEFERYVKPRRDYEVTYYFTSVTCINVIC